ncbi:hypothetical protein NX862_17425 [Rhodobacter sp. KR11]|jgi:hypothetical protein|uniref:hypothetical protein n=1 Tax=Rhodobacter sp. KR11 TaxID=2974588 RepID=UPI002223A9A6|nr:hypothetical protein [Rhodobacter sp. KR11]MCW1920542.1 hypothetical protein [Rhodobacter sp. KR11]
MRAAAALRFLCSASITLPVILAGCTDPQGQMQVGRALCWQDVGATDIACTEVMPEGRTVFAPTGAGGSHAVSGAGTAPRTTSNLAQSAAHPSGGQAVARSASADEGVTSAAQSGPTEAAAAAAGYFGANAARSTPKEAAAASANGSGGTAVSYTVDGKGYAVSVGENGIAITELN